MIVAVLPMLLAVGPFPVAADPGQPAYRVAREAVPSPHRVAQARQPTQAQAPPAPAQPVKPPVPHRTETVNFDDWSVTCQDFSEGPKKHTCAAQLQVQQSGTAQIVLTWRVFINDGKQLVAVLQTPTGVMIVPGAELQLEKAAPRKLAFESCEQARCTAAMVMDSAFVKEATTAATASVNLHAVGGNTVQIGFSMKGFDKASAHLRANSR